MSVDERRQAAAIFDKDRLRVARQLRQMTRTALAGEVGVSTAAVSLWESGTVKPKPETLAVVARVLSFPVGFFATTGQPLPSLDADSAFFRSRRKSRPVDRDAAMAHAAIVGELVHAIERHATLPDLDIPDIPLPETAVADELEAAASAVRRRWELGTGPIEDVVRELERHGAVAARLPIHEDVDAFSWPHLGRPVVILSSDKDARDRSRFDAAHELGHLVLHRKREGIDERVTEKQAHRFAGAFLLPREAMREEWPKGRLQWPSLLQLKRRWHASLAALLYRARDLELVSPTAYTSTIKYMSRVGWRRTEPGMLGRPEEPQLLRLAVSRLAERGVTLDTLASELQINVEDLAVYIELSGAPDRITIDV